MLQLAGRISSTFDPRTTLGLPLSVQTQGLCTLSVSTGREDQLSLCVSEAERTFPSSPRGDTETADTVTVTAPCENRPAEETV